MWPPRNQLIALVAAVILTVNVAIIGDRLSRNPTITAQIFGLLLINCAIYFSLYRQFPKLGVAMLILMHVVNLAALGYFVLAASSFTLGQ